MKVNLSFWKGGDTSLSCNRNKVVKRLQILTKHKNDQTKKPSIVGIANYSRYMVFGLSRGLYQCFLKNLSKMHTHTHTSTFVNTENCSHL